MFSRRFSAAIAAVVVAGSMSLFSSNSNAIVLFDSNGFEAPQYAVGSLNGQNGWGIDNVANPTRFQVLSGANQVVGASGGTQSAVSTNWINPETPYIPAAGELVVIEVDIARSVGTTTANSSFGYFIDVYGTTAAGTGFARTTRFGLSYSTTTFLPVVTVTAPFSNATGFQAGQPVVSVSFSTVLAANTFYSFRATLNYTAKTLNLNVGGLNFGTIPFAAPTAARLTDADLQVSSITGATDAGFWDNYRINAIPEPSALAMMAPVALMATRRRRA